MAGLQRDAPSSQLDHITADTNGAITADMQKKF
jgi:hypothetical protein